MIDSAIKRGFFGGIEASSRFFERFSCNWEEVRVIEFKSDESKQCRRLEEKAETPLIPNTET